MSLDTTAFSEVPGLRLVGRGRAASHNVQVCSTVVFAELHWTPGTLLQVCVAFFARSMNDPWKLSQAEPESKTAITCPSFLRCSCARTTEAEDRAHRRLPLVALRGSWSIRWSRRGMGQQESVNVHYLIAKDTLDVSRLQAVPSQTFRL